MLLIPINKVLKEIDIKNKLVPAFLNDSYFPILESLIENHDNDEYDFSCLREEELIYFYIHRSTHLRRSKSVKTKKEYARDLLQFYFHVTQQLGNLKQVNAFHMKGYQEYLNGKYKPNTVSRKNVIVKSFMKWLFDIGYLSKDVTTAMKSAEVSRLEQPNKDISIAEIKQLMAYYKNGYIGDYLLVTLLAMTGMRVFELAKSKWGDLTVEETTGFIFLKVIGKRDGIRFVRIYEELFSVLVSYREQRGFKNVLFQDLDVPLFPTHEGVFYNPNYLSQRAKKLIVGALPGAQQRNITAHSLRHGFAHLARSGGADLRSIQQALGHEDYKTTERYLWREHEMENHASKFIRSNVFF